MTPKVELLCFTDPYCSWCWASEPALLFLQERYRDQLSVRFVMGGLVRDMSDFLDAANGIQHTREVAPHWRMVAQRSGQPIDERLMLDITDEHWSTWPANVAVKAAERQGTLVSQRYLRRLRRAALTERALVSDRAVQLAAARQVTGLDVAALERDLDGQAAQEAFAADRALCAEYGAHGFPTMVFRVVGKGDEGAILVNGHRPLSTYLRVLDQLGVPLEVHAPREVPALLAEYGPLTTREASDVVGRDLGATLAELATRGEVTSVARAGGTFWAVPGDGSLAALA